MNSADLVVLQELLNRTRTLVGRLGTVCRFEQPDPQLLKDVEAILNIVGELANQVQYHELVSWRNNAHPPRHPAPRHIHQDPPLSTEIDHGVHVERFGIGGDRLTSSRPRLSGAWDPGGRRARKGRVPDVR